MMDNQQSLEEMVQRGIDMQALYEQVEKNNKELRTLMEQLPDMSDEINRLTDYYLGEWINDRDALNDHPVRYNLMFAEDPIYDEIQEWDTLLENLEKKTAELLEEFRRPR